MRRLVGLIVAAALLLFAAAGIGRAVDGAADLRDRADSLVVAAKITDATHERDEERRRLDSLRIEGLNRRNAALRADLDQARASTLLASRSLDSARATVDVDTLAPALRGLILVERRMAESWRQERDIFQELLDSALARIGLDSAGLIRAQLEVLTLRGERDEALELISDFRARSEFSLWRWLGDELPTFAACATGGAVASVVAKGDALVGGVIGLASCVTIRAVF